MGEDAREAQHLFKARSGSTVNDSELVWLGLVTSAQLGRGVWDLQLNDEPLHKVTRISIMDTALRVYCYANDQARLARALVRSKAHVKVTLRTPKGTWEQQCRVTAYAEHCEFPNAITQFSIQLDGVDDRRLTRKEPPSQ